MELFNQFISEYGTTILYAILTALTGIAGTFIGKLYKQFVNDKTKEKIVKICVKAVEQLYKDLHGEEKYNKVVESAVEMLAERGITISELELKMLVEATLAELNDAFNNEKNKNSETDSAVGAIVESVA